MLEKELQRRDRKKQRDQDRDQLRQQIRQEFEQDRFYQNCSGFEKMAIIGNELSRRMGGGKSK